MEKSGGARSYHNPKTHIDKPAELKKLIPDNIGECALYLGKRPNEPCSSEPVIERIAEAVGARGDSAAEKLQHAKEALGCGTEVCVLKKMAGQLPREVIEREINTHIKLHGPTDTALLSNEHIDRTLQQWRGLRKDFFAYNFNMIDYAKYSWRDGAVQNEPDTLATVDWRDLYNNGFRCSACVINSDSYHGRGKHWMALFVDTRGADRWSVEFFNSSGNAPAAAWVNWLIKTRDQLETIQPRPKVEIIRVCNIRQQQSKTECGVYSLFYIWARLNNYPPEFFQEHIIPDQFMMEFRQHLFRNEKISLKKFNFDEYAKMTKVTWE